MSDGRAMTEMTKGVVARGALHRVGATDLVAITGMLIVATAIGVGLYLQLGMTAAVSAALGLAVQVALLAGHGLVRQASALKAEVARLRAELDGLKGPLGSDHETPRMRRAAEPAPPPVPEQAAQKQHQTKAAAKSGAGEVKPEREAAPRGAPEPGASGEGLPAPWSFRPASPPELSAGPGPEPAMPALTAPREADVELIQGLIKKLAEEVNATEPPPAPAQRPNSPPRNPEATEAAIEVSLEALRTAAQTMRATRPGTRELPPQTSAETAAPRRALPAPETPLPATKATPSRESKAGACSQSKPDGIPSTRPAEPAASAASSPTVQARLATLTEAITAGRVDVLLEPILGLEDQRARHFEVSIRLRGAAGETLEAHRGEPELRGTGLFPMLDCASIARTAQVARRLADRGRSGAVLSPFSSEALGHDAFLNEFAEAVRSHESFADQLVLAFSQSDVRALAPHEWETLADMRDLGFRFALQAVTDLDMDFEALKAKGFSFVKLDADVFLEGMPAPVGPIPAADICRHLARLGLTLIVGGIDNETKLARIFGFGVLLGQGQMFGGPRPVKAEALGPHPAAA